MKSHLQVKVFTLAAEMQYIHKQERRWKARAKAARAKAKDTKYHEDAFWSLRNHRQGLKPEARSTHLAYGLMKGRSYQQMENICYGDLKGFGSTPPDWNRIEEIVTKFSSDETDPRDIMQKFGEWLAAAKIWYEGNPERIEQFKIASKKRREDVEYQVEKAIRSDIAKKKALGELTA
jgi:hypothetical protein